ncbi:3-hydroxyacyl-ACP dehydratase FabZ family protein [Streptomyces avermitilis]|uniref:3-hydroxyacyl-ACP dehydratase FabZ family protein n=1 Tax=Streptomyces avermitilis TaxID=33903 RepID=UPI0036C14089
MSAATPLGDLELIRTGPSGAVTAFDAPVDGPVIAGHYPGFPVLPGVFLIEAADRTVRQWAKDNSRAQDGGADPGSGADSGTAGTADSGTELELAAMDRCRFHRPVYPGDRVLADVSVVDNAAGLLFKAAVATNRGKVADIRLRYRAKQEEEETP